MKKILFFLIVLIVNLASIYGQSGWRADLRVYEESNFGVHELNVRMIVDLYYNNGLVTPQPNYKYEFFERFPLVGPEWITIAPQWGINTLGTHANQDSTELPAGKLDFYCKITLPDNTVITADIIRVPWYNVIPNQKKFSGSSFGSIDYWYKGSFKDNNGLDTIYIPRYDPKVLQADINVVSNPPEKYNYWTGNFGETYYNNFVRFSPNELLLIPMVGQFNYINNTTVRAKVDNNYLDVIQFKDPWFRDYDEQPFGIRNQGLGAIPQPLVNDENNLGINTNYQGVLLNQPIVSGQPYYSIEIPSSIYLPQTGQTHNIYLQSWVYSGASLENENSLETGVVFTSSNGANVTANVKATQISDNQNAFINNSQRKIVRTPDSDNTLHMVYESMGHVWYETSTDNGQNWILMNNGHPLDNGGGKSPSIDYAVNSHNFVVIVFQENSGAPPNSSSIKAVVYKSPFGDLPFAYLETETIYSSLFYSYNTNPVISISSVGSTTIVWEVTGDGLYYRYAGINNDGLNLIGGNAKLSGTTIYSKNPSISASRKVNSSEVSHLVWEENNSIKYFTFNSAPPGTIKTISTGSYPFNHNASVIAMPDGSARFCWRGQYYPGSNSRLVFGASNNTRFWYFGSNVRTPQITASDDNTEYYVIWNEVSDNSTKFTDNSTLRDIYDLNTTGQAVQLSNGLDRNYMYALVYNNQTQQYFFKISPSIGSNYGSQKSASNEIIGRGGVVLKDRVGFFFMLDNISVDNQPVDFVEVSDTIEIDDIMELNKYLISQPFTLTDNSVFNYTVIYGITDSSSVDVIAEKNSVSYNLDLIEAKNGNKLGNIAEVLFDKNNLPLFDRQVFELNPEGIGGSKAVQLKITAQNNFNGKYLLTESYADIQPSDLPKTSTIRLSYKDFSAVKDYVLEQNNPNPFNPSTTILYQLSQDGLVTLKIYDILGREVITLVDEFKTAGRYEEYFNASSLASGVYLYRLTVNDYVDVKKMLMIK